MAAVTIWTQNTQKHAEVTCGTSLETVLLEMSAAQTMPCGGNHTCGKCRVRTAGALSPISADERVLLGEQAVSDSIRLACFATVLGDCSVWMDAYSINTLAWTRLPHICLNGKGYGLAVDIGTTTIAMRLYDCASGETLAEELAGNRQASFGADVISRIGRANDGEADALTHTIRTQLDDMAQACKQLANIEQISSAVVTGNTTMLHFYEGLDASGIACAPFTATSLFDIQSAYSLVGAPTYLPPCIGAYVGADIVCALLASEVLRSPAQCTLLADIGTNGEIALFNSGKLYCCSTAAGPAFEGAGLHQGMCAAVGAVAGLTLKEDGTVTACVIGGGVAIGICGSGALDAVSIMLRIGVLDGNGQINQGYKGQGEILIWDKQPAWRIPDTDVLLTQKDIRQLQLAKSAICAGIRTLLQHTQIAETQVETFYIAGGFGYSMNAQSASHIGLFPSELLKKTKIIGNGALAGASMLLLDAHTREQATQLRSVSDELSLSSSATFMDFYIDGMMFEEDEYYA